MIINNLIRGGGRLNRLFSRQIRSFAQQPNAFEGASDRRFTLLPSLLNIEKFVEFDKLDLYGTRYENVQKLLALRKLYKDDPNNVNNVYRYVRELNRQGKYQLATEVASAVSDKEISEGDESRLARLIKYHSDYASKKLWNEGNFFFELGKPTSKSLLYRLWRWRLPIILGMILAYYNLYEDEE